MYRTSLTELSLCPFQGNKNLLWTSRRSGHQPGLCCPPGVSAGLVVTLFSPQRRDSAEECGPGVSADALVSAAPINTEPCHSCLSKLLPSPQVNLRGNGHRASLLQPRWG